ncbi:unnamed protein product [Candidula unifasciata]|uniref:UBC core domain-containing protein n=1 Tax=Candidula unifasciata TaxID=100452 RepID=A0A8S3Z1P9_9EUPU|nr:unnamed protein product [Candidula unifasciata]
MFSRAHLLIELEHQKLLAHPPWDIEAWPLSDDSIFEWVAKIKGLRNTLWEDGVFTVYIKFDEHYNVRPPTVFFQTVPFHPNVDMASGRPCIDFLDDYQIWNENYSLSMILVSLQALLSNPVCENAVNVDAARMLMTSPDLYHRVITECVANSHVIEVPGESVIKAYRSSSSDKLFTAQTKARSTQSKKLSFEEYHRTWLRIATSKAEPSAVNLTLDSIQEKSCQQNLHLSMSRELAEQVKAKQLQSHNLLVYGPIKLRGESEKEAKLAKLNRMKQMYLPCHQASLSEIHSRSTGKTTPDRCPQHKADASEDEVEDLVQWSRNLDSNFLEHS